MTMTVPGKGGGQRQQGEAPQPSQTDLLLAVGIMRNLGRMPDQQTAQADIEDRRQEPEAEWVKRFMENKGPGDQKAVLPADIGEVGSLSDQAGYHDIVAPKKKGKK